MGSKDVPQFFRWNTKFFGWNTKSSKSGYFYTERKMVEKPHRFGRHRSKIGLNPNVFAYFKSTWEGANMPMWVQGVRAKHVAGTFVTSWSKETPPPRGGFLFSMFPDQEPCVRDFTTRCDGYVPWSRAVCKRFHDEMTVASRREISYTRLTEHSK